MSKYVVTPETFDEINHTRYKYSFIDRIKEFFKHVWYVSVAPRSPTRDHYRQTFRQYKTLDEKMAKKIAKKNT